MTGYTAAKSGIFQLRHNLYIFQDNVFEIEKGQKQNSFNYILVVLDESKITPNNFEVALCIRTCET